MKPAFPSLLHPLLRYGQRGILLLSLSGIGAAAGAQSFAPVSTYSTGTSSSPYGVKLGDINGDGRLDIVTATANSTVGVLLGQAGGSFAPVSTYAAGAHSTPWCLALGDVNGDGRLDIVTLNAVANTVQVLLGQAGGFAPAASYSTSTNSTIANPPVSLALGDVNGDGRLDIVNANSSSIGVLLGQASGGFAPISSYSLGPPIGPLALSLQPGPVVLGDLNGDGSLDIVTPLNAAGAVGVLLGQAGGFAPIIRYPTDSAPGGTALGDINNDGRLDIITVHAYSRNVGVLLGQAGGFAPVSSFFADAGPWSVMLADMNGDSRLDIVTANRGTAGVIPGQPSSFGTASAYPANASSVAFPEAFTGVVGDVNSDGRPDIVTANSDNSTVGVLLNTGTYTPLATTRPTSADIALSPNPAHEAFTVQLPATFGPVRAELLNALGQVVRRPAAASASFPVATDGLAPGIYTLRLHASDAVWARRVVVE